MNIQAHFICAEPYALWTVRSQNKYPSGPKKGHIRNLLTQDVGRSMASYKAGIIPVTHAFLQNSLAKIFPESTARCYQAVVPAISLGKSAQDRPGNQSAIGKYRDHALPPEDTEKRSPGLACQ